MSFDDAFAPTDADYRSRVQHATFGHLAPKENQAYPGTIVFSESPFGQRVVLSYDFKDLPDSPWFAQHLSNYIFDHPCEDGMIYRFVGTYVMDHDGNGTFTGTTTEKPISSLFHA